MPCTGNSVCRGSFGGRSIHWVLLVAIKRAEDLAKGWMRQSAESALGKLRTLSGHARVAEAFDWLAELVRNISADVQVQPDPQLDLDAMLRDRIDEQTDSLRTLAEGGVAELTRLIDDVVDRLAWSPPLGLDLLAPTEESLFIARSRGIEYVPREQQRDRLTEFLDADTPFSWWVMTGGAGAGKTRLALELCHGNWGLWDAGFLGLKEGETKSWHQWRPLLPTLIVLDYASSKPNLAAGVLSNVQLLASTGIFDETPVRVLLIDRTHPEDGKEADDPRWRQIYGTTTETFADTEEVHAMRPLCRYPNSKMGRLRQ